MYIREKETVNQLVVALIVDDLLSLARRQAILDKFVEELKKYLELSMQGPVSVYLGWQVTIDRQPAGTIVTLSQQKYAIELLQRAGMMDSNPVSTPVNYGEVFTAQKKGSEILKNTSLAKKKDYLSKNPNLPR